MSSSWQVFCVTTLTTTSPVHTPCFFIRIFSREPSYLSWAKSEVTVATRLRLATAPDSTRSPASLSPAGDPRRRPNCLSMRHVSHLTHRLLSLATAIKTPSPELAHAGHRALSRSAALAIRFLLSFGDHRSIRFFPFRQVIASSNRAPFFAGLSSCCLIFKFEFLLVVSTISSIWNLFEKNRAIRLLFCVSSFSVLYFLVE